MANDKKKQVEQITDMEVDFAQWYTDVCKKAELIDYSSIKGMFIYRPYAEAAMAWANGAGLITGVSDTTLQPRGNSTRAQVATILMRFCQKVAE